ncbi:AAA family ATPase [Hyalangium versicolor]|uniref:AAA family ATPase n=1 Tax=Hyalangium versicolor TaxID=2861190 RepID=UPI001CCC9394|nr:AAA family ATPase [Hyalangium versicolor]
MEPARDRITEVWFEGVRTLERVRVRLNGLTVLIGENGSGKSTFIEACELLRRAAKPSFFSEFYSIHGGLFSLLRQGSHQIKLGVRIEGGGDPLEYEVALMDAGGRAALESESLTAWSNGNPVSIISRPRTGQGFIEVEDDKRQELKRLSDEQLALSAFGVSPPHPAMSRMMQALGTVEVHPPFQIAARWVAREQRLLNPAREPQLYDRATRLARGGSNLANAFAELKNSASPNEWTETMEYVQLGLGRDIESVITRAEPGGGNVGLYLKYAGLEQELPAISLSDGTLAYMALVALVRLKAPCSLMALDEPDLHFHPYLLARLASFCEEMSRAHPVILGTHSDHLLDLLSHPAESVVLLELDERTRTTQLFRPDPEALEAWLQRYRGLGDIREEGHLASIMTKPEPSR